MKKGSKVLYHGDQGLVEAIVETVKDNDVVDLRIGGEQSREAWRDNVGKGRAYGQWREFDRKAETVTPVPVLEAAPVVPEGTPAEVELVALEPEAPVKPKRGRG